jgi:hypothetical protein
MIGLKKREEMREVKGLDRLMGVAIIINIEKRAEIDKK